MRIALHAGQRERRGWCRCRARAHAAAGCSSSLQNSMPSARKSSAYSRAPGDLGHEIGRRCSCCRPAGPPQCLAFRICFRSTLFVLLSSEGLIILTLPRARAASHARRHFSIVTLLAAVLGCALLALAIRQVGWIPSCVAMWAGFPRHHRPGAIHGHASTRVDALCRAGQRPDGARRCGAPRYESRPAIGVRRRLQSRCWSPMRWATSRHWVCSQVSQPGF